MRILIPLLLLCISMPSWAQRQFDIEVIIFKRVVGDESMSESWPDKLPDIDMMNVGSLDSEAYLSSNDVTLLPSSSFQLEPQKAALEDHAGFKVLKHIAWRQGDQAQRDAPIFRIIGGQDFSGSFYADGTPKNGSDLAVTNDADEAPLDGNDPNVTNDAVGSPIDGNDMTVTNEQDNAPNAVDPLYELDGKLQIYVQHYLFAETTMDLREPSVRQIRIESAPTQQLIEEMGFIDENVQFGNLADVSPTVTEEAFLKTYRFNQKRRMRSGETHYLDSPVMGMIIQVRRVELEEEEEE